MDTPEERHVPTRPDYIPSRIVWFPGEATPSGIFGYKLREAHTDDLSQVARLLRSKPARVAKWIASHGYTVWLAVRHSRTALAAFVVRHGPEETTVLRYTCSSFINELPVLRHFTLLAQVEVPELIVRWQVKQTDLDLLATLQKAGWKVDRDNPATKSDCIAFCTGPLLIPR